MICRAVEHAADGPDPRERQCGARKVEQRQAVGHRGLITQDYAVLACERRQLAVRERDRALVRRDDMPAARERVADVREARTAGARIERRHVHHYICR